MPITSSAVREPCVSYLLLLISVSLNTNSFTASSPRVVVAYSSSRSLFVVCGFTGCSFAGPWSPTFAGAMDSPPTRGGLGCLFSVCGASGLTFGFLLSPLSRGGSGAGVVEIGII